MVKYFHFHYTDDLGITHKFDEKLVSKQCNHIIPNKARCLNHCEIGLDLCWIHLETIKNLKIQDSKYLRSLRPRNKGKGQGLYAFTRKKKKTQQIFKKKDVICNYNGEFIDKDELDRRYGEHTGPYGITISTSGGLYEDAAIERGVGAMINHSNSTRRINCHLVKRRDRTLGRDRVSIVATKNINNGSELITTYGDNYRFDENVQTSTNSRKKIST
jgi:hypothetical protein